MQKFLRIFLLVLIIIGFVALLTRGTWVPKLVNSIVSSEVIPVITPEESQPNIKLVDGEQCYTYSHDATATEPYATTEFIDMNIAGTKVTGTKRGTQKGPDMTNGYTGTMLGTLDGDTITSIFSYIIEGSKNKEKEVYQASKTGIDKLRYQLIEQGGILVPDTSKEYKALHYSRVGCKASN